MERLQNEGRLPPTRRYGTNNSKSGQSSRRGMSFDNVWARSDDEAGPSSAASSFSTTATTRKAKTGAQKERSEAKSKGKTTKRDEDDEIDNFPASKNNARKTSKERSKLASGSRRTGSASKELGLADIYEGLGGSSKRRKTGEDSPTSPKAKTPLRGLKLPGRFEPSISENRIESCDLALASSSSDKETNTPDVSSLMPRSKSSRARALIVPKKRSDPGSGSKTQTQKSSGEAFADSLLTTLALGSSQGSWVLFFSSGI